MSGNATYGPVSFTPTAPGTYHWVAVYSGDPPNTNGTSHNVNCTDTDEDAVGTQCVLRLLLALRDGPASTR